MKKKMISAVILTQNCEKNISTILDQLELFSDEVIMVDGGSVDDTLKIAETKLKTKIFHRAFDGDFGAQRNFGMDKATGKWILSIDTDELFCRTAQFLIPLIVKVPFINWYKFYRVWLVESNNELKYISNKPFYPDKQMKLFRNKPAFRYRKNLKTHQSFSKKDRGFGLKLPFAKIIHFDFLIRDRKSREKKVSYYMSIEPSQSKIHKRYLWEDQNVILKPYKKKLPGLLK